MKRRAVITGVGRIGVAAVLVGLLLVAACAAPTAAPGPAATYQYKWRATTDDPEGSPLGDRLKAFCDEVREGTNGRVDISPYYSSVLGSWEIMTEMLMRNDIQVVFDAVNSTYDPRLAVAYYMPFLVKDYDEYWKLYGPGGLIRRLYSEIAEPLGIVAFGAAPRGLGGLTTTKVPPSPGDPDVPKNMKIRIMGLKECRLTYERLGYMTTAISYNEVYSALQTGIVEGQMGGGAFQATLFKDVQDCYIQYNDYCESYWFSMNKESYDSLTPEDQKVITDAAEAQCIAQYDYVREMDQIYLQELRDAGLEVIILSPEEIAACAAAIREDVWPELELMIGTVIMYQIYDELGIEHPLGI